MGCLLDWLSVARLCHQNRGLKETTPPRRYQLQPKTADDKISIIFTLSATIIKIIFNLL